MTRILMLLAFVAGTACAQAPTDFAYGIPLLPEGNGPFPAIIGMHDCAGLWNATGAVAAKYRDWAQRLAKDGFIVLFPESYSSRGLGNQCASRNRPVRPDRERVADANASRRWLEQHESLFAAVCAVLRDPAARLRFDDYCALYSKGLLLEHEPGLCRLRCQLYEEYLGTLCRTT